MRKESSQVIGAIDCFDYDTTNCKAAIGLLIDPGHNDKDSDEMPSKHS